MNGSMSNKEGRVRDDGFIYMVLEYGEIDLAHMLAQKWKELDGSTTTIDENWLRFYWQVLHEIHFFICFSTSIVVQETGHSRRDQAKICCIILETKEMAILVLLTSHFALHFAANTSSSKYYS